MGNCEFEPELTIVSPGFGHTLIRLDRECEWWLVPRGVRERIRASVALRTYICAQRLREWSLRMMRGIVVDVPVIRACHCGGNDSD